MGRSGACGHGLKNDRYLTMTKTETEQQKKYCGQDLGKCFLNNINNCHSALNFLCFCCATSNLIFDMHFTRTQNI